MILTSGLTSKKPMKSIPIGTLAVQLVKLVIHDWYVFLPASHSTHINISFLPFAFYKYRNDNSLLAGMLAALCGVDSDIFITSL
jgi:hypothetical protein